MADKVTESINAVGEVSGGITDLARNLIVEVINPADAASLGFITPHLTIIFGALFILIVGLWIKNRKLHTISAIVFLAIAACFNCKLSGTDSVSIFSSLMVFDPMGSFLTYFSIFSLALVVLLSHKSKQIYEDRYSDYLSIVLALGSALLFMGQATHFLLVYLALETLSILSFTLAGFQKEDSKSSEASLKYVVYGALASGIMLYGISLMFGITGTLTFSGLQSFFVSNQIASTNIIFWVSILMILSGVAYKISAFPFHMWTPDVYEGAPTPVTTLFSVAPKAAGLILMGRFLYSGLSTEFFQAAGGTSSGLSAVIIFVAIMTMTIGNLSALAQTSVKRILAYSAIAHAGYMLMGFSIDNSGGVYAVIFYLIIYCLMNIGAFWVTSKIEQAYKNDHVNSFNGLIRSHPFYAITMTIFLCSLIGLPPFVGFIGKYQLFLVAIKNNLFSLVVIASINSVVSLYYYMKIVRAMILNSPNASEDSEKSRVFTQSVFNCSLSKVVLVLLAIPNLLWGMGIGLDKVIIWAKKSAQILGGF